MAKYQQYKEYKDSGYFHLGEIPKDWKILKLKHLTRCLDGQRIPLNAIERGEKKGNIPYWGANKIVDYVDDWIFYEQLILLGEDGAPFFDPNKDVAFLVNGKIWPNNHVHVLRPFKKLVNPTFLTYAINCTDFSLYISGSTRDKLNQSDMDNICIRYCSQAEQIQIANFLDHETAKIDSLIEKQQQLIELLKEKRQAVISHVVTKGLNPDVAMKDSGVEWLGQVPEHWMVSRLKYIKSKESNAFVDGPFGSNLKSEHFIENGDVYVIESNFATTGYLDPQMLKTISFSHFATIERSECRENDIIIAKIGARYGSSAILPKLEKRAVVSGNSLKLTVDTTNCDINYALNLLRHLKNEGAMDDGVNGSAQPALSLGGLNNIGFLTPPIEEQKEITKFIYNKLLSFNGLIEKAAFAIQLMQERRTALISAAVTGKIDVRNWQNPNNNNEAKTEFSA